jgi:hypothetical protein
MATVDELKQRRAALQAESEELPRRLEQLEKARNGIVGFECRPEVKEKYECERARLQLSIECSRLELRALSGEIRAAELESEVATGMALLRNEASEIMRKLASASNRCDLARARLGAVRWLVAKGLAELPTAATWMCRIAVDGLSDKEGEQARQLLEHALVASGDGGGRGALEEARLEILVFLEQMGD